MFNWLRKLEVMAAAAAFAEEGEWRTARRILQESGKRQINRVARRVIHTRIRAREHPYRV
ncbi:MAG: hypothetical protein LDL33_10515 [Desulfomonile sp.]|nr:hypothetical protein [Desulfomonile sp.]